MCDSSGVSRRRYLAGLPAALGTAGCVGLPTEEGETERLPALVNLAIQNVGLQDAVVSFEVEQEDEVVHAKEYTLESLDPGEVENGTGVIGSETGESVRFEGKPWMNERVRYSLTADLEGGGSDTYTTDDYLADYGDRNCGEFVLTFAVVGGELRTQGRPAPPCETEIPLP